jgi:hypothetical protein
MTRDEVHREFQVRLDAAYKRYLEAADDGKEGAQLACQAVSKFLFDLGEPPERAAVFMALTKGFQDLRSTGRKRGATIPPIFSRLTTPDQRPRSSLTRHLSLVASAMMDALMKLGDDETVAAEQVARKDCKWPYLSTRPVTATTVINWRKRKRTKMEQFLFQQMVDDRLSQDNPRIAVQEILAAPPGVPSSSN